jgi:hypothetical protein
MPNPIGPQRHVESIQESEVRSTVFVLFWLLGQVWGDTSLATYMFSALGAIAVPRALVASGLHVIEVTLR